MIKNDITDDRRPLTNEELEHKISMLEVVVAAFSGYLLTSQAQEDELIKLYSSLEVLLLGVLGDAIHAGHSEECSFVQRIIDGLETIQSATLSKSGKKLAG